MSTNAARKTALESLYSLSRSRKCILPLANGPKKGYNHKKNLDVNLKVKSHHQHHNASRQQPNNKNTCNNIHIHPNSTVATNTFTNNITNNITNSVTNTCTIPKPSNVQCQRSRVPRASLAANVIPISRAPLFMRKDFFRQSLNSSNNGVRGHYDVAATATTYNDNSERYYDSCNSDQYNDFSAVLNGNGNANGNEPMIQSSQSSFSANKIHNDSAAKSDLVVVLDMDECIIHSQFLTITTDIDNTYRQYEADRPESQTFDYDDEPETLISSACESFRLCLPDGDKVHVNKRPNLDTFLKEVTSKYQTYIFTAAMEVYAAPLLNRLDPDQTMFAGRFYREHCTFDPSLGVYVKDLSNIRCVEENKNDQQNDVHDVNVSAPVTTIAPLFDEKRVVLVDNNPYSFLANPTNGILVSNFYDDPKDDTLHAVIELLDELESAEDVRPILDEKFGLEDALKEVARTQGSWK